MDKHSRTPRDAQRRLFDEADKQFEKDFPPINRGNPHDARTRFFDEADREFDEQFRRVKKLSAVALIASAIGAIVIAAVVTWGFIVLVNWITTK